MSFDPLQVIIMIIVSAAFYIMLFSLPAKKISAITKPRIVYFGNGSWICMCDRVGCMGKSPSEAYKNWSMRK